MSNFQRASSWIRGSMHISWHIMALSLGVILGVIAAPATRFFDAPTWLIVGSVLLVIGFSGRLRYLVIFAFCAGIIFGLWRGGLQYVELKEYDQYYGKTVMVVGKSAEDMSIGKKGDQRLRVSDVRIDGVRLPGTIWVSLANDESIKRGDIVIVKGILSEGFGTIPASMFRAEVVKIEYPRHGDIGREARDWFATGIEKTMSKDNAELALAYLVGQKLASDNSLNDQLKVVGLIHAVVASGAHLTILVGAVRRLFVGISKYLTVISSIGLIIGFILITGFSPSMNRAGLVSGLSLLAWYYGRVIHPFVLLPFVAAITVVYNPSYVWGDVGWYLSFAAFAGIMILAPLLHHYFWGRDKSPGMLREIVVATVAASVTTLPITIAVFGYYSPYALLANVLVLPLVPLTMLLTFIVGMLGLAFPLLATWASKPLNVILEYMKSVVDFLAHAPGAQQEVAVNAWMTGAGYMLIACLCVYLYTKTGHDFRRDRQLTKDF